MIKHQKLKYYLLIFFQIIPVYLEAASNCTEWVAKVVSVQGKVETQRLGIVNWKAIQQGDVFCQGDKIRSEKNSRATLQLSNNSLISVDQNTNLNFSVPEVEAASSWLIELFKGSAFFRSRESQRLNINTPFINAVHEGTEFLVTVNSEQTEITVFDGQVAGTNQQGKINIKKGFTGIAKKGEAPRVKALTIRPEDAVQWTLYYPPIVDYQHLKSASFKPVINAYEQGNTYQALDVLEDISTDEQDEDYLILKSSLLLTVGRVEEALKLIKEARSLKQDESSAIALQSIISVAKNRQEKALKLAQQAVTLNPQSAIAQIALSYAYQSNFKIEPALQATKEATRLSPDNALAWARLSELQLSTGERSDALESAKKAQALNPRLDRTHTILGFAYLAEVDIDEAKVAFKKAINLNPADPLARLGLGLAKIRKGDIEEGTQDLETAVTLDPENAIMRSYLGKAHYELKNEDYAATELAIAKEMDPKDPTPWYYDAILKQTTNRPVEALHDMQRAIELNDNRAVYRSSLLLDEDLAARTANLARIYQDLGFDRKALVEAWKSSNYDRHNHSTHRFLSDAHLNNPRHRITSNSELLQSQLLQPLNLSPIQPQQTGVNSLVLNDSGSSSLSLNEFNPLFLSNGAHLVANGLVGSNDTWAENVIVSGIWNKLSVSFGQFHYQTDAKTKIFPYNKDLKRDIYSAFAQYAVTPKFNIQMEIRTEDIAAGDISSHINDPETDGFFKDVQKKIRERVEQDTIRFGGHYQASVNNDFILSGIYTTFSESEPATLFSKEVSTNQNGYQFEGKQLFKFDGFDTQVGLGYARLSVKDSLIDEEIKQEQYVNGYVYVNLKPTNWFSTTLGISIDSYEDSFTKNTQINPKLGFFSTPFADLVIRAAFFRSLKRSFVTNQTIEPTQISGFNQFYDDKNGTDSWNYGIGLDYIFSKKMFMGGEVSWRKLSQSILFVKEQNTTFENRDEINALAYLYWVPSDYMAARVEYQLEKFERDFISGRSNSFKPEGITNHSIPFSIKFFNSLGVFFKLGGTYVNQEVKFVTEEEVVPNKGELFKEKTAFWVFDTSIGYRLPNRFGLVSFEVKNIFNNYFRFQSSFDAFAKTSPAYFPERQFFLNVRITF